MKVAIILSALLIASTASAEQRLETQVANLQALIKGQRVGLLICPTSVDSKLRLLADRLQQDPKITLTCFFAPEHGLRGDRQAGEKIDDYTDEATGLPVYSVYGKRQAPTAEQLRTIDVLVCDMQDVGVRFYTRMWQITGAMEAAAKAGVEVIIFDRPNPIGLDKVEGAPTRINSGLVGPVWPGQPFGVPTRHGMTMGEIATLVNEEWSATKARLTVVKIPGYTRTMTFEETGYPWVMPSPNMPTIETAGVYPGTCVFEGSNVSEGRGTTRPFELIGAPFVDPARLAARLNSAGLKGVLFRPAWFTPTFEDFAGKLCGGVQLHVTDRNTFDPIRAALVLLKTLCEMYPEDVQVTEWASKMIGVPGLHKRIRTDSVDSIIDEWQGDLQKFQAIRRKHLLY